MAGNVLNIKVCSPLKLPRDLTGNYHTICHYSYNLPLHSDKVPQYFIAELENTLDMEIDCGSMIHEKVLKSTIHF